MSSTAETPLLKPPATRRRGPGTLLLGVVVCCAAALAGVAVTTSDGVAPASWLASKAKAPKPTPKPTNVPPPRHKTEDGEVWLETSYVEGGRRKSLEQFGYSFAASSDFLVVGAPNAVTVEYDYSSPELSSYNYTTPPGKVTVYKRTEDDEWEQFGSDLVGEAIGDSFGFSVAVSQTSDAVIVAVSAAELDRDLCKNMSQYPVEFTSEDECLEHVPRRGVTRVYWSSTDRASWEKNGADITYPQTTLRQESWTRITNDDLFKQSVAMDAKGETIVVAVPVVAKGYIFSNSHLANPDVPWAFDGELKGPLVRYYSETATVVAISEDGTMAALGDPKGSFFEGDRRWRGFANVYTKTQYTGIWLQNILIEGHMDYAQCGWSLALSDGLPGRPGEKRLAIGCPGWHAGQSERPDYGGPTVIVCSPTDKEVPINWSCGHIEQDEDDQFTEFGRAVAFNVDGTQVAVGAPRGGRQSAAYFGGFAAVFDIEGDNDSYKQVGPRIVSDRSLLGKSVDKWFRSNKKKPFAWYQYLGHGVAFSGDVVVVSAPGDPLSRQVFWDDEDYYDGGQDQPAQVRDYQLGKPPSDGAAPRVVAALSLAAAVFLAL